MYGWLIINEFLKTEKFVDIKNMFEESANKNNVTLDVYTNADFTLRIDIDDVDSVAFNSGNPDFVIFYDKDIALARALERKGIRLYNRSEAIRICDSKLLTYEKLASKVKMPESYIVPFTYENIGLNLINDSTREDFLDRIELLVSYPLIIKETYSSFGMGVHLVNSRKEAVAVLNKVGNRECVIQEYVDSSYGEDVRIQMVGDKCVAAMKRINKNDFRSNITNGGSMEAYTPNEEQLSLARKVMQELKLDFAGIDILFGNNNKPVLCEVNSNAHFRNLYDCTGVDTSDEIIKYIINDIVY